MDIGLYSGQRREIGAFHRLLKQPFKDVTSPRWIYLLGECFSRSKLMFVRGGAVLAILVLGTGVRQSFAVDELGNDAAALPSIHPDATTSTQQVVQALSARSEKLVAEGRRAEAETVIREALRLLQESVGPNPAREEDCVTLGHLQWQLGHLLWGSSRVNEAAKQFRDSVEVFRRASEAFPESLFPTLEHCWSNLQLGSCLEAAGHPEEAVEVYRHTAALHDQALQKFPDEAVFKQRAVQARVELAGLLSRMQQYPEAERAGREALRLCSSFKVTAGNERSRAVEVLVHVLGLEHRIAEAEPLVDSLVQELQLPGAAVTPSAVTALGELGKLLNSEGKVDQGASRLRQARDHYSRLPDQDLGNVPPDPAFLLLHEAPPEQARQLCDRLLAAPSINPGWWSGVAWQLITLTNATSADFALAFTLAQKAATASGRADPGCLSTLAATYAAMGDFTNAVRIQQNAIEIARNQGDTMEFSWRLALFATERSVREREPLSEIARRRLAQGKPADAEKVFDDAIALASRKLGETNAVMGNLYYEYGDFLYFGARKPAAATVQYQKALLIREKVQDDKLVWTLRNLGSATHTSAGPEQAEPYLRRALDVYHRLHTQEDLNESVQPAIELAETLYQQRRLREAESAYRAALTAAEPFTVEGKGAYANALRSLLQVLRDERKLPQGEALCREILAKNQPVSTNNANVVIWTLSALADNLSAQGRLDEAETALRDALRRFQQWFGSPPVRKEDRVDFGHLQWSLGGALRQGQLLDEAEEVLRQALDLLERTRQEFPDDRFLWLEHGMSAWLVGEVVEQTGRQDDAVVEFRRALAVQKQAMQQFPDEENFKQRSVSFGLHLAELLTRMQRYAEAEQAYEELLRICSSSSALERIDCATAQRSLARLSRLKEGPMTADSVTAPATNDLWDVSRGVMVRRHSPLLRPVDDVRDVFGGHFSPPFGPGEGSPDHIMFADGHPNGYVNYVEWATPSPVTVRSFNLWANGDGDSQIREMARFRLLAKSAGSRAYDVVLYEFTPTHPYSWVDGVPFWLISAQINPTTAQEFRAEFINYVRPQSPLYAPRIAELDGFGDIPPPLAEAKIPPQPATPAAPLPERPAKKTARPELRALVDELVRRASELGAQPTPVDAPPRPAGLESGSVEFLTRLAVAALDLEDASMPSQIVDRIDDPLLRQRAQLQLAEYLDRRGRTKEARQIRAAIPDPVDPMLPMVLARNAVCEAVQAGRIDEARAHLARVLDLAPANYPSMKGGAVCQFGQLLVGAGRTNEGMSLVAQGVEQMRPYLTESTHGEWVTLRDISLWQADHREARAARTTADLILDPEQWASAHLLIARAECLRGDFKEARLSVEALASVAEKRPPVLPAAIGDPGRMDGFRNIPVVQLLNEMTLASAGELGTALARTGQIVPARQALSGTLRRLRRADSGDQAKLFKQFEEQIPVLLARGLIQGRRFDRASDELRYVADKDTRQGLQRELENAQGQTEAPPALQPQPASARLTGYELMTKIPEMAQRGDTDGALAALKDAAPRSAIAPAAGAAFARGLGPEAAIRIARGQSDKDLELFLLLGVAEELAKEPSK